MGWENRLSFVSTVAGITKTAVQMKIDCLVRCESGSIFLVMKRALRKS